MLTFDEKNIEAFLEHHGIKGQKWGVRNARKEIRATGKEARQIIKQSNKTHSTAERNALAKKYEKDILKKIQSKDFKDAYRAANTVTKGQKIAHILLLGPLAALTIPEMNRNAEMARLHGPSIELAAARSVLRSIKNG